MFYSFNYSAYIRVFVKALIEINVNMSNELNFSDVFQSVNYIGLLAKFTLHATSVVYTSINIRKMKFIS